MLSCAFNVRCLVWSPSFQFLALSEEKGMQVTALQRASNLHTRGWNPWSPLSVKPATLNTVVKCSLRASRKFECLVGGCPQNGNVNFEIGIGGIVVHSRILVDKPNRSCLLYKFGLSSFTVWDAGNTSLVDADTPLGATTVVTPGSASCLLWECCILASL